MEEIYIALINKKGEIYCEIQDGKLTIPNVIIEKRNDVFHIWDYLNKSWGIITNLSFPRKSYVVSKEKIKSHVVVIKGDEWKKANGNRSMHFIGCLEFQNLCDQRVVSGGWGNKECLIGLGAFYLQDENMEVKSWAKAKLISILTVPENNLSTI